jgi:hypothetical protein
LAADAGSRWRDAAAAREWVSARYGWDEIARSYDAVYREAVAARTAP